MSLPRFTFTQRARPFLEVGVGDSRIEGQAARWDVQRWDASDALWGGVEPNWQDVTCHTFAISITAGRDRTADRFTVATMTVTAGNLTGWADFTPPTEGDLNTLQLRPGRSVRFGVDHVELGRVVLFRGVIDAIGATYDPDDPDAITLEAIDALGEVGRPYLVDLNSDPSNSGEEVDARLERLLDLAQWPPSKRRIDGSSLPLLPIKTEGQVADLVGITADSAGGSIFGDPEGDVVYRALDWQMWPSTRPPDATIGNVEKGDVCPVRWERPYAREDMANVVHLANTRDPDPDKVQASDLSSWGLYGIETFERTDLTTQDPAVLQALADRYLETRGAATIPRVRAVTLDARTEDNVVDLLAFSSPYVPSRYRCRLTLARGPVFDEEYLLTGISHDIGPEAWTADLSLDLAAPWRMVGTARWEPAIGPNAGRSKWDRVTWS